jgi:hypothetical protein
MADDEPLSEERLAEYVEAFKAYLPATLEMDIRLRTPRSAAIIPAGAIKTVRAQTHSIENDDLMVFIPDWDNAAGDDLITISAFPQRHIDYMSIVVMPPKFCVAGIATKRVARGTFNVPLPAAPRAMLRALPNPILQPTATATQPIQVIAPLATMAAAADGDTGPQGAKRAREEAEEMGDAIRGESRKRVVCTGLRVPQDITPRHEFLYPPVWSERISNGETPTDIVAAWKTNFLAFVLEGELNSALSEQKRREFYAVKEQMCCWIEFTAPFFNPDSKLAWTLPFGLTNHLTSLIALARGGAKEESLLQAATQLAFDKGMVDYTSLLATVKNWGTNSNNHDPPSHNNSNRGRGYFRGRGTRGSYRGFSRRGRGRGC